MRESRQKAHLSHSGPPLFNRRCDILGQMSPHLNPSKINIRASAIVSSNKGKTAWRVYARSSPEARLSHAGPPLFYRRCVNSWSNGPSRRYRHNDIMGQVYFFVIYGRNSLVGPCENLARKPTCPILCPLPVYRQFTILGQTGPRVNPAKVVLWASAIVSSYTDTIAWAGPCENLAQKLICPTLGPRYFICGVSTLGQMGPQVHPDKITLRANFIVS
jgi:hypothetical protein